MQDFFSFLFDHWILTSGFLFVTMLLVMYEMKRKLLGFRDLSPQDAIQLMNKQDAIVLDVRDESEFKAGHIVNARNYPVALIDTKLSELTAEKERPVLIYCKSGQRSARAGALLNKQGFTNVYKLAGGMMAWENANLPVVKK